MFHGQSGLMCHFMAYQFLQYILNPILYFNTKAAFFKQGGCYGTAAYCCKASSQSRGKRKSRRNNFAWHFLLCSTFGATATPNIIITPRTEWINQHAYSVRHINMAPVTRSQHHQAANQSIERLDDDDPGPYVREPMRPPDM